ncbi:hypothetical protein LJB92_03770 [Bacteroidales bacterium OttesenSCG-928-M06]|nr:hypothetical protein [Bacteroidales bacterium OttesenSCG-928-M06]
MIRKELTIWIIAVIACCSLSGTIQAKESENGFLSREERVATNRSMFQSSNDQDEGSSGGSIDRDTPIESGLGILIAASAIYGIRKRRKQ